MSDDVEIHRNAVIENIATMIACICLIAVIGFFTEGAACLWGLLVLLNMNTYKRKKGES